jgi:hypothetical protein
MKLTALLAAWLLLAATPGIHKFPIAQEADRWLEIQGEYAGNLEVEGRTMTAGIQLIALGDNQFAIRVHRDGLPGEGSGEDPRSEVSEPVEMQDGKLVFNKGNDQLVWEQGVFTAYGEDGEVVFGELKRVDRQSDTLGQQPPEGAVVLFDGTSGEHFQTRDGGDPLADGLLRQGIRSTDEFGGDFSLHLEFRLPFEPEKRGQGRGNSGLYVQGRYEVQMLDSFGLTGEANECGGIYGVRKPDINMCFPPTAWQTYDIEFRSARWDGDRKTANARMTVRHNGVLIHDDVEVPGPTTAAPLKETPAPGYLFLQDHGSPVRYRNIWLVPR